MKALIVDQEVPSSTLGASTNVFNDDIPAANVEGSVDTGPLTAFTGSSPFGGVALMLDSITILGSNKNSSQNNTLDLNINLFSLPGISAGTYSGTMHLQAQAL